MKAASIFFVLVGCLIQFPARGMIENMIKVAGVNVVLTGFNDAQTDATPDSSTVRFTLSDSPLRKCWEWRVRGWQSGSADLTAGLDVTLGTDIEVQFQKFPNGDA